jgi:hypothetical protein
VAFFSEGSAKCILFFIVALFGVSAGESADCLGCDDMHLAVFLWPGSEWLQPHRRKYERLLSFKCTLFMIEALSGVSASKP